MTQKASGNRRLVCNQGSRTPHAPPSPSSDGDHSVQKGSDMRVKCFFAVLDPEGTAKLNGTKNSACLGSFSSVNRLKEHLWRAHSPTHNCPHCRQKTTKPTKEFKELHARCQAGGTKITRPLPTLFSNRQADSLGSLNQHYNKPNNEKARCEKLWKALFPGEDFDEKRFACSGSADGADGEQPEPNHNHAPSPSRKPGQHPKTSATVSQNATPPTSPGTSQRSKETNTEPLFSVVKKPTGKTGIAQGTLSDDSAIDMGTGDDDDNGRGPSRRQSVDEGAVGSRIRWVGANFQGPPEAAYAKRVLVEGEDSTPPPRESFGVRHNSPEVLPSQFAQGRTRSEYTESVGSRSDPDMSQSDCSEDGEDDDDDNISTGRDSGIGGEDSDIDMLDGYAISDAMEAVRAINRRGIAGFVARDGNWDSDEEMGMASESDC